MVVLLLSEEVNHHLTSTPNGVVQEYCCKSKLEPFELSNNVENTHKIFYCEFLLFWLPVVDILFYCGVPIQLMLVEYHVA